jgi:hypothetical protein
MDMPATRTVHKRLGIIFDFDDTLAADSFRSLLGRYGIDKERFEREQIDPLLADGWDAILAKMYCLVQLSQQHPDDPITRELLRGIGRDIQFFDGVPKMFERVQACATAIVPEVEICFYLLSSGFLEIVRGTPIVDEFTELWGCTFHYDDAGRIIFPKQLVTHAEKVRYVLQVSKGVSEQSVAGQPTKVYREVPEDELHIPLSQIIYLGDGASDLPVFGLLHGSGGVALGIFKGDSAKAWREEQALDARQRVENLARADYAEDSELMRSLTLAVESMCKRIALRTLSAGE